MEIIYQVVFVVTSAFVGAAGGSIIYHIYESRQTKKRLLNALFREIQYNKKVHESRFDFLRRPYHTASYSEANTRGVLATLPQEEHPYLIL